MVFWFSSALGSPPHAVFLAPGTFALGGLPPFYHSSWVACRGPLSASGFGIGSGIFSCPVDPLSCNSAYWFLLSELVVSAHCVEKFFPLFGSLYWAATWRQVFFLILIVLLLSFPGRWSVGFSILPNACPLLVMIFLCLAFVLLPVSLCSICFLTVCSPSVFCLGLSRFSFVRPRCLLLSWFVMSCLASLATSFLSSLVSL